MLILKLDRILHFFVNYWQFNAITMQNGYFFLLINEIFDSLINALVFLKFEVKNVYYQLKIQEQDKSKIIL